VVTLTNSPVIESSLKLEIQDEKDNWHMWRLKDDLLAADIEEEVFSLDPESGRVQFGTGLHGARPQLGRRIRASYQYGGGTQGNVAIGELKSSPDVRLQGGFKIENPIPTWGGDEGESVAEAERNIPRHLRHRDRLVTAGDFEDIARRTPGVDVGRVEVLPLFDPDDGPNRPGVVTVMVVPKYDALRPRWPTPDRLFLRQVCEYLEPRRLVTTEIYVCGPSYVAVHLSVGVQVREGFFRDTVLQAVHERLHAYLSAWGPDGPEGEEGNGWPLERKLVKKDLEAVVTRVSGVEYVTSMELGVGSTSNIDEKELTGLELPLLSSASVREGDAEPLAVLLYGEVLDEQVPSTRSVPIPVRREKC
jgi:predicted phage baseplate assembly protein